MKIHIGIDPGKSGGIACIPENGDPWTIKMPDTEKDIWEEIQSLSTNYECTCMIELVHAMPKQGVTSTFTFGYGYGGLRMALVAAGIRHEVVTPQKWQKALGCQTKGDKNVSKTKAQQLFPSLKITHANADALLIAEYCRLNHK